jgi:type I restriction enzyme, S subunit
MTAPQIRAHWKPYPSYKDSGVEWLGEIPAHWGVRRLKFAAHVEPGQSPPSDVVVDGLGGLPFLQGNADFGARNPTPRQACDVAPKRAARDDILLSVRAPVGALNIADRQYGIGRGLCAVRPQSWVDSQFCFYTLVTTRSFLGAVATGSTYDAVTASQVGDLPALLPPMPEQRAIATFLDRETARIDALVTKKERVIELLQEERTALITRAVTKGLDPSVPMKDSSVEWLGEFPAHWEVKKTTWLFSIGSGTTPKSEDIGYYGGDTPWITTSELRESVILETEKYVTEAALKAHSSLKLHPAGSVAVAMYGATIGRLGVLGIDATVNQACCVFSRPRGVGMEFWFYWLQMRRPYLISLGYGGGQPNLSQELLRSVRVPTPPVSEQAVIAAFLGVETARIDALIAKVLDGISRLNELRTALVSAAVTGKIDVREEAA